MQTMNHALPNRLSQQIRQASAPATAAARHIGHFLYGDEARTRASILFGISCMSVHIIALAKTMHCALGGM